MTDGVVSEPSSASLVANVFPQMPPIKSYAEAATDYYVVHPSSSFQLQAPDEWKRWRTNVGSAPSSCSLINTMGSLAHLYGFDPADTWSPSCSGLECPEPGQPMGDAFQTLQPITTKFKL